MSGANTQPGPMGGSVRDVLTFLRGQNLPCSHHLCRLSSSNSPAKPPLTRTHPRPQRAGLGAGQGLSRADLQLCLKHYWTRDKTEVTSPGPHYSSQTTSLCLVKALSPLAPDFLGAWGSLPSVRIMDHGTRRFCRIRICLVAHSDFWDNSGVPNLAGLKPQNSLCSVFKNDSWLHSNNSAVTDPDKAQELFTNTPNMADGPWMALGETWLSLEKAQLIAQTRRPPSSFSLGLRAQGRFFGADLTTDS